MSSAWLNEVSPSFLREKRIDVTLDESNTEPAAFDSILLNVSYARTLPQGVVLPLVFEVRGPSPQSYQQRIFSRTAPATIVFTPREGGPHSVTLREVAHNRWWGGIHLDVTGERLEAPIPS